MSVLDSDELDAALVSAERTPLTLSRDAAKYRVVAERARRDDAVVEAAINTWTGRRVVIERAHGPLAAAAVEARLVRARLAARLVHAHAIEVLDLGLDEAGAPFVVYEDVEGEPLADRIARRGPIPLAEALALLSPIADALAAAHEEGLVHGDVGPRTIVLVRAAGRAVARLGGLGTTPSWASGAGELASTPPEALAGAPVDARTDVWGLSAALHFCLTGRSPFEASDLDELRRAHRAPPRASERALGVGPIVDDVLGRALVAEPSARTPTMRALLAELVALREEARPTLRPTEGASEDEPSDTFPLVRSARVRPLRLGLVWTAPSVDLTRVAVALEHSLVRAVQVLRFRSYAELVDAVLEADVELGWLPPVAYVRARRSERVRLLFATVRLYGPTYRAAILGRRGVVGSLEAARGKRAVWVDGWSAAGYLVPRVMLERAGVDVDGELGAQGFVGGHAEVVESLARGAADLGATYCHLDGRGRIEGPFDGVTGIDVVAVSDPIPGDTLCAGPAVDPAEAEAISLLLLRDARTIAPLISATSLTRGEPSDYDALESALLGRKA